MEMMEAILEEIPNGQGQPPSTTGSISLSTTELISNKTTPAAVEK